MKQTENTVRLWLHLEGVVLLGTAVFLYGRLGFSWLAFALLLLWPDVAMVGYLVNPKVGSQVYNLFHTYSFPAILGVTALVLDWSVGLQLALIWLAHIGMDRMMGYGFKYSDHFKHTHFDHV